MEEQLYAIADYVPKSSEGYLTTGKPYKIVEWITEPTEASAEFEIIDDDGDTIPCIKDGCAHLRFQRWRIVKESDLTPEQRIAAELPPERNDTADAMRYLFGGVDRAKTEDAAIAELREQLDALERRVREITGELKEQEWPYANCVYWYITERGKVQGSTWRNELVDKQREAFMGIFRTRGGAEAQARRICRFAQDPRR